MDVPPLVEQARQRAADHGFGYSCAPLTGELLAVLSAAVRPGGRILELGTGMGVGLAWALHGLRGRADVTLVTVEQDPRTAELAATADWPAWVEPHTGDAVRLLPGLGTFDLVFADAEGGKWHGLDRTLAALGEGGVLLLDDMDPERYTLAEHHVAIAGVRAALRADTRLVIVDLPVGTGHIIATVRRGAASA
ncbi:O-methyltransferase [Kitasatospora sp. NBC_00315]|uniref:O-methyltransferase n=1 Tax=Kitasatospora sp. NBC_00315 TaxID=2975963 RepID=UPI00324E3456